MVCVYYYSRCLVPGCKARNFTGFYPSTLRQHFKKQHQNLSNTLELPRKCKKLQRERDANVIELRQHLVELVTCNGRPLNLIDEQPMKVILRKTLQADHNLFTREKLIADIYDIEQKIKKKNSEEVKDRPVTVLIDCATKFNRQVIGVNIQYFHNGQIENRTLGIVRLSEPHTAVYIAMVTLEVLGEFGITAEQIYSMTTDNAANMLKARKDILKVFHPAGESEMIDIDNDSAASYASQNENVDDIIFDEIMDMEADDAEMEDIFSSLNQRIQSEINDNNSRSQKFVMQ